MYFQSEVVFNDMERFRKGIEERYGVKASLYVEDEEARVKLGYTIKKGEEINTFYRFYKKGEGNKLADDSNYWLVQGKEDVNCISIGDVFNIIDK